VNCLHQNLKIASFGSGTSIKELVVVTKGFLVVRQEIYLLIIRESKLIVGFALTFLVKTTPSALLLRSRNQFS